MYINVLMDYTRVCIHAISLIDLNIIFKKPAILYAPFDMYYKLLSVRHRCILNLQTYYR